MPPTREELIEIAKRYWSSEPDVYEREEYSPESLRLYELWEQELAKIGQWWAFLKELRSELPGYIIGDGTATPDACFRCVAYLPQQPASPARDWVVVGCVSILAPVYTVYAVQFEYGETTRVCRVVDFDARRPEIRAPAEVIARRIEATFGVSALPREIAETPVPLYVEWKRPPETTLFHALFTNEPERLP